MNKKEDMHIHTNFSPDADQTATFSKYIAYATEIGLQKIAFTDHLDIDAVHPLFQKTPNLDEYRRAYLEQTKNVNIETVWGIEIGYQPHTIKKTMELVQKYQFEYVILSIHYIDKMDLYTQEFFSGKTKKEAYQRYFEVCLEAIQNTPTFHTFGHLDYITRYSPFGDYDYDEYKEIIDLILVELIQRDKIIEINTSGFKSDGRAYPKKEVIERFIELGGTKIVCSSDAHSVSELGREFDKI